MKPAALGFRIHSGWTALVAISLEEGFPQVILRERPRLVRTFTFEFRQPYHTAKKRPLDEARDFISQVRAEARDRAHLAIHSAQRSLEEQGYAARRCGLLAASGKTLPELPQILASHALIHTADGELFREAILHACEKLGLDTLVVKEKEVLEKAVQVSRLSSGELTSRLADLGHGRGSPWTQDEKLATLAAWLSIV